MIELQRLRWSCRRGMLELDLLLLPFFEKQFANLIPEDQILFADLLSCQDQDLYAWLVVNKEPDEKRFLSLIQQIRQYAQVNHTYKI